MISNKLQDAINNQIQAEMESAQIYLAMSVYSESKNLRGFAHWLKTQYQEETGHAFKLLNYLIERGGVVKLQAIPAPDAEFGTPVQVFEKVLAHEIHITSLINKLYELAIAEKDFIERKFVEENEEFAKVELIQKEIDLFKKTAKMSRLKIKEHNIPKNDITNKILDLIKLYE